MTDGQPPIRDSCLPCVSFFLTFRGNNLSVDGKRNEAFNSPPTSRWMYGGVREPFLALSLNVYLVSKVSSLAWQ